jgi:hypothetical protein
VALVRCGPAVGVRAWRGMDVLENIDPIFYGDLRTAGFKASGLN